MTPAREILLGRDGASRPVVFVAMPTGQVLANLLALFELAEPGDRVLWLATAEAVRLGWMERSRDALTQRCPEVSQGTLLDLAETLDAWGDACVAFADEVTKRPPVMIINGGTKLLNYSVAEAFRRSGHARYPVAYASTFRPPGLMLQPAGHGGRAERIAYGAERFPRMAEVLAASGHRIAAHNKGTCLWRAGTPIDLPPPQPYGTERAATFDLHAQVYRWMKRERLPAGPVPNFADADLDGTEKTRLRNAVDLYLRCHASDGALGVLYNSFRKVSQRAADRHRRAAEAAVTAPPEPGTEKLDVLFEAAVAGRLLALLAARPDLAAMVGEVWRNVEIAPEGQVAGAPAEFDVLVLMRHGAALALECKSGLGLYDPKTDSLSKDMHARAHRLGRTASTIARLVVCLPMFREAIGTPWQDETLRRWRDTLFGRHPSVFFTLPDDPGGTVETQAGPLEIPAFDAELARLIAAA